MKFGKDLEQYKCAGWEDQYIDYKGLKLILKNLEQEDANEDEVDADFFQALEDELEKVWKPPVEGGLWCAACRREGVPPEFAVPPCLCPRVTLSGKPRVSYADLGY